MNTPPAETNHWVCVYCGSRDGADANYRAAAETLGHTLAKAKLGLVYGGARLGLMGALANAALEAGAPVIGVMPHGLVEREYAHQGLTELHVVETMHQRKQTMFDTADGFIALPGGFGTLEELFEILTWKQIGWHDKPVGLLDTGGFYQPLISCINHMLELGFVAPDNVARIATAEQPQMLVERITEQLTQSV